MRKMREFVLMLQQFPDRFQAVRFFHLNNASWDVDSASLFFCTRLLDFPRKAYPTMPARVEYELTRLGRSLLVPIKQLGECATQNRQRIQAARDANDTQKTKNRKLSSDLHVRSR